MIDLLKLLLEQYGPTWGPALFSVFVVVGLLITRIERRVYLHEQRLNLALLDKDIFSFDDLVKYRLVDSDAPGLMEFLR